MLQVPPLSLYIHIPWCVRKCPYCDFNSHRLNSDLPEAEYCTALAEDLKRDQVWAQDRPLSSIFFGGGTPSLFSPQAIEHILNTVQKHYRLAENIEITLEANPGTVEQQRFIGYKTAGINRLSLGIQSFQDAKLTALGRIHDANAARTAISAAQRAGFDNLNLDLMYGLPQQTVAEALDELHAALAFAPAHLSWYQLTLEPHTAFYHHPPPLPAEDFIWEMQVQGQAYLAAQGFDAYEISAYCQQPQKRCRHNLNYWQFGDYLGTGAGSHGKITDVSQQRVLRYWKTKHPRDYLNPATPFVAGQKVLQAQELPLEFMLNTLRLYERIPTSLFTTRTGLPLSAISSLLEQARQQGWLEVNEDCITVTEWGRRYLNEVLLLFIKL